MIDEYHVTKRQF